jgi:tyrosine-protein kinase Etk/Wzc
MTAANSLLAEPGVTSETAPEKMNPVDEVTLIEILTQLALRKWLILGMTGAAMLIGIAIALLLPVRYTATTRIMPPQQAQSSAAMMMNQLAASSGGSPLAAIAGAGLGLKNPNDIYVGMLNSRPVADAIIQKFNLRADYHSRDMTAARKKLAKFTTVTAEKSGFILVSVSDKDKKRVADMANAYVDELRALTRHLAVTEASRRRLFYEEELKDAKESLVAAESAFQQVQQNKGLVALDAQAKAMIESLTELRARAAAKQVQLQALRSYATDRNPEVEITQRELTSIQDEITRMEARSHTSKLPDLGLEDVPGAGLEYLRAEHEVKYRQALFDLLIRQYDAARLDESKEPTIIQVMEPPIEPDRKSSPKRTLIVLASSVVGLFIGCVVALLQYWFRLLESDPYSLPRLIALKSALQIRKAPGILDPGI